MAFGRRLGPGKKTLGPYELVTELHQGYLGPVWAARADDGPHAGVVVLARRISHGGDEDADVIESLSAAAEWATGLAHPHVRTTLGVVRDEAELSVISAYREAEPLRALLRLAGVKRRPIPAPVVLRIAHDILAGLSYLHEQLYDGEQLLAALNPDHVYIGSNGHTQISEPAVATVAAGLEPWTRNVKRVAYDSPERLALALGKPTDAPGPGADIFTLGVLMWELLRNRPLFAGAAFDAVAKRVRGAAIRRVDALKPAGGDAVAASVAAIVERALQRDPQERYALISEMSAALEADTMASHEEVSELFGDIGSDVLAKQRRKVAQVGGEVGALSGTAAASTGTDGTSGAIVAAAVIPIGESAEDERQDEVVPNRNEMPTIPAPGLNPQKLSEKQTLMGMSSPSPGVPDVSDPLTGEPFNLDASREEDDDSLRSGGSLGSSIEESLTSSPEAARDSRSSGKGYDMFSIADDPSLEEELPPEAMAALARVQAEKDKLQSEGPGPPTWMLGVAVGVALLVVVIVVMMMGGDETSTAPSDGAATATATASAEEPGQETGEDNSATTAAASSAAPAASSSPSSEGSAPAPKAPIQVQPRQQPRQPSPQPKKKYTPGGI